MLRLRNVEKKDVLKVVKELDAFPKVPETYQETSATSGGCELICSKVHTGLPLFILKVTFNSIKFSSEVLVLR